METKGQKSAGKRRPWCSEKIIERGTIFTLICIIIAIQNKYSFLSPIAGHEDGRDLLPLFFNDGSFRLLVREYAGYVSFGPNLLAYLASIASIQWIPFLYAGLSALVATGTMTVVVLDRSQLAAASQLERFATAVMLIVIPLGKTYMFTNVTYSQWHMLFMLFILSLQPLPRTVCRLIIWTTCILVCTVSNPLSILVFPLLIRQWIYSRNKAQRMAIGMCVINITLYQLWGIQSHPFPRLTLESAFFSCRVFLSRVVVEVITGPRLTTALEAHKKGWLTFLAGTGLLIFWVLYRIHQSKNYIKTIDSPEETQCWTELYMWVLAFVIVFISTHLRYADKGDGVRSMFLLEPNLQRYIYVPKLIVLYLVFSRIAPVVRNRVKRLSISGLFVMGIMLAIYLSVTNISNAFLYQSDPLESRRLATFLHDVQLNLDRKASGEPYADRFNLVREGDWDICIQLD